MTGQTVSVSFYLDDASFLVRVGDAWLNRLLPNRSTLPSEAIEEFLSILRPSSILFPPTSPILRPSNGLAHGFVPYRRPGSCSISPAMSNEGLGITLLDQTDNMAKDSDAVAYPFKIIGTAHLCTSPNNLDSL